MGFLGLVFRGGSRSFPEEVFGFWVQGFPFAPCAGIDVCFVFSC